MQKILVEVSHQDQIYVENECTNKGLTISEFYSHCLELYKKQGCVSGQIEEVKEEFPSDSINEFEEKAKPKRGRKKKEDQKEGQ